jgi:P-type Cu2+ transporter
MALGAAREGSAPGVRDQRSEPDRLADERRGADVGLSAGETVIVIPADGLIVDGTAEADESVLTGESLPVEKQAGDGLFSGTVSRASRRMCGCSRPGRAPSSAAPRR